MSMLNPFISFPVASGGPTDTGWLFPTSSNQYSGDDNWNNLAYIYNDDTNHASVGVDDLNQSAILRAGGYGFAIPDGADILGVEVEVDRYAPDDDLYEDFEQLLTGGTLAGNNRANNSHALPKSSNALVIGSSSDLWGLANGTTITAAICNHPGFGFALGIVEDDRDGTTLGYYNYNKIKVHYET